MVCHLGFLAKLYPKEIRGMCNAIAGFLSFVGIFAYVGITYSAEDEWPFITVSIADISFALLIIILSFFGFFRKPSNTDASLKVDEDKLIHVDAL